MYGAYTGSGKNDEEDEQGGLTNNTQSDYLANLLEGSHKKYERRLGKGPINSSLKPMRMGPGRGGTSLQRPSTQPRRPLMPALETAEKRQHYSGDTSSENVVIRDLALTNAFENSIRLSERVPVVVKSEPAGVPPIKSPDSGSFSMSLSESVNEGAQSREINENVPPGSVNVPQMQSNSNLGSIHLKQVPQTPLQSSFRSISQTSLEERLKKLSSGTPAQSSGNLLPSSHTNTNNSKDSKTSTTLKRNFSLTDVPPKPNLVPVIPFTPVVSVQPPQTPYTIQRLPSQTPHTIQHPSSKTPMAPKDQYLYINGGKYRVMRLLGKGGSSRVYEAFDENKPKVVAIKRVDLSDADESQTAGFVNEINMLSRLQSEERIVKLYDYETVESEDLLYVVMEKGETDLASLIKRYTSRNELTPAMIKHYWTEMLHGVSVIHRYGIIHKDLKPANFLLVAGQLKLIDFGIASSVQSDKTSVFIDTQLGTFNFMSPESIEDLNGPQFDSSGSRKPCIKISVKSDVWSLGCILYNLIYGKLPFGDIRNSLMKIKAITDKNHEISFPPLPEGLVENDEVLIPLLKSCLQRDPKARPGISELLAHPYVTGETVVKDKKQNDRLKALQHIQGLEGILSPNTLNRTKESLLSALHKEES